MRDNPHLGPPSDSTYFARVNQSKQLGGTMDRILDIESEKIEFKPVLRYLLASYLTSACLSLLICEMRIIIAATDQDFCEDQMR